MRITIFIAFKTSNMPTLSEKAYKDYNTFDNWECKG